MFEAEFLRLHIQITSHNVTYVILVFPLLSGEGLHKLRFRSSPVDLFCVLVYIFELLLNKYV